MKILTKEWVKDYEMYDLICMFQPFSDKKIPFVFTNGGEDCVAKEDLLTAKTKLNVTEKENELNFIMLPDTFDVNYSLGNAKLRKEHFLSQYLNRLRVISYLPEDILKNVRDKRLLALGYADKQTKKEILKYAKRKDAKAFNIFNKSYTATDAIEKELTIHEQLKTNEDFQNLTVLFDYSDITKVKTVNDKIYLRLDDYATVVFSGAKFIEQEVDILNTYVSKIELHKNKNDYELHLLLRKSDENFIYNYYYATIAFKDMKLKK